MIERKYAKYIHCNTFEYSLLLFFLFYVEVKNNNQKSVVETKLLTEKTKKPAATVDEVTELLSAASVSGALRQKTFKISPLQLKGKEETQEERRKRALEDQKKVKRNDLHNCQ